MKVRPSVCIPSWTSYRLSPQPVRATFRSLRRIWQDRSCEECERSVRDESSSSSSKNGVIAYGPSTCLTSTKPTPARPRLLKLSRLAGPLQKTSREPSWLRQWWFTARLAADSEQSVGVYVHSRNKYVKQVVVDYLYGKIMSWLNGENSDFYSTKHVE